KLAPRACDRPCSAPARGRGGGPPERSPSTRFLLARGAASPRLLPGGRLVHCLVYKAGAARSLRGAAPPAGADAASGGATPKSQRPAGPGRPPTRIGTVSALRGG